VQETEPLQAVVVVVAEKASSDELLRLELLLLLELLPVLLLQRMKAEASEMTSFLLQLAAVVAGRSAGSQRCSDGTPHLGCQYA